MRLPKMNLVLCVVAIATLLAVGWAVLARPGSAAGAAVTMYKAPGCFCCDEWRKHMEAFGFTVDAVETDLGSVKGEREVPPTLLSCHTAVVEGHVLEGHVPAGQVWRMLRDPLGPYGIAVAGMPPGAPGMSGPPQPYEVVAFEKGRPGAVYATY